MERFMSPTMGLSGHQLRYDSVDLSEVRDRGGRGSTITTSPTPRSVARLCAAATPAMPAPMTTTSAEAVIVRRSGCGAHGRLSPQV